MSVFPCTEAGFPPLGFVPHRLSVIGTTIEQMANTLSQMTKNSVKGIRQGVSGELGIVVDIAETISVTDTFVKNPRIVLPDIISLYMNI